MLDYDLVKLNQATLSQWYGDYGVGVDSSLPHC